MTRSCIITHDGNCIVVDTRHGSASGRNVFEAERELTRLHPVNPDNSNSLRSPLDATDRPGVPSSLSPGRPFKQVANV
jgi:hypothetical protein